jgi:uncharacterized membrane protein
VITLEDESKTKALSQELREVRKKGIIRLVDMIYMTKDAEGNLLWKEATDLTDVQQGEYGTFLRGLMSMTAANRSPDDTQRISQALSGEQGKFGLTEEQFQRMAELVKPGGSAMLALFEHTWAIGLREAVLNAGGKSVMQVRLNPSALEVGGTTLQEALDNAARIESEAEAQASTRLAQIEAAEAEVEAQKAAKLAEAERILKEAKMIAAANIVASVRAASIELDEADQILVEAQTAAGELVEQAEMIAAAEVSLASEISRSEIESAAEQAERIRRDADRIAAAEIVAGAMVSSEMVEEAGHRAAEITTGAQIAADEIVAGAEMAAEDEEE